MLQYHIGTSLLDTKCQYICHQVNCQGKMNSGVAKAIREKWPEIYHDYLDWITVWEDIACDEYGSLECGPIASDLMLGHILTVAVNGEQSVINMAAQQYYGYDGRRYTSYDAFWLCLGEIKNTIPAGSSIAFPCYIGCGLGGADWKVISTMIDVALGKDYDIHIYKLEETK